MILSWYADVLELERVELDAWLVQELLEEQAADEGADGKAIRLGGFVNIIGRNEASRPGHVVDDEDGIARNVFTHMTRYGSRVGVIAASRGKSHTESARLSLVKIRLRKDLFGAR